MLVGTGGDEARPRPLDGEVLLDALSDVTGMPDVFTNSWMETVPEGTPAIGLVSEFVATRVVMHLEIRRAAFYSYRFSNS